MSPGDTITGKSQLNVATPHLTDHRGYVKSANEYTPDGTGDVRLNLMVRLGGLKIINPNRPRKGAWRDISWGWNQIQKMDSKNTDVNVDTYSKPNLGSTVAHIAAEIE